MAYFLQICVASSPVSPLLWKTQLAQRLERVARTPKIAGLSPVSRAFCLAKRLRFWVHFALQAFLHQIPRASARGVIFCKRGRTRPIRVQALLAFRFGRKPIPTRFYVESYVNVHKIRCKSLRIRIPGGWRMFRPPGLGNPGTGNRQIAVGAAHNNENEQGTEGSVLRRFPFDFTAFFVPLP